MARRVLFWSLALAACATPARAQQTCDDLGIRALGMAGAFVGVADDASGMFWNSGGLTMGPPIGLTIGATRLQTGNHDGLPVPGATSRDASFSSVGSWPLGVSYARRRTVWLADTGLVRSFETAEYGVTVLQSVHERVVLGSTLKYVRGRVGFGPVIGATAGDALDSGRRIDTRGSGAFDFDVGLMIDFDDVRIGVSTRNLREPEFTDLAGTATRLRRQARMGAAWLPADGLTLAIDVDLDTVDLRGDLRRVIALGGEDKVTTRVAVRAGVRWDLEGSRAPAASAGASVVLRRGLWLDGYVTQGGHDEDRGFGLGLRFGS
jgi:hypothetical protein